MKAITVAYLIYTATVVWFVVFLSMAYRAY